MARIRTIKPEFWTDPSIMECSLSARLLLIGMLNFADDKGNIEGSVKMIKVQIFPADNIEVSPLLEELIKNGLILLYVVSGRNYYHIKGFVKHQKINRPSPHRCPIYEPSLKAHGGLSEDSPPEGKGREGKGEEGNNIYIDHSLNTHGGLSESIPQDKHPHNLEEVYVEPVASGDSDEAIEELQRMNFDILWKRYPAQVNKNAAYAGFKATVRNTGELQQINMALDKYLKHLEANDWKSPQNGDTWFTGGWKDYIRWREPEKKKGAQGGAKKSGKFHGLDDKDYRTESSFGG